MAGLRLCLSAPRASNCNGTVYKLWASIGGWSAWTLQAQSTRIIQQLHTLLQDSIPIIASGGVMDANTAQEKFNADASLVQVYSGLIYSGPKIIKEINEFSRLN